MAAPKVLVFSGYGLNCEDETKFAFEQAGAQADIVHINDLIEDPRRLNDYQIAAFPGGFSYGDDTGAGNAYANKLNHHLGDAIRQFVQRDTLTIGICNGFQIISNLGLVPAIDNNYGKRSVALTHNDVARYVARWIDVKVQSRSPWLLNLTSLSLPIAHGEGRLIADAEVVNQLKRNGQIALTYVEGETCKYLGLPARPNGSVEDIAGLTDASGRVLGMMPHPERAINFTHQPHWPQLRQQMLRSKQPVPCAGPGRTIFDNAVAYFN